MKSKVTGAVRRLDGNLVCSALDAVDDAGQRERLITELLSTLQHGSMLVSKRRDEIREAQIAAFVAQVRGWLEHGAPERLDELDELVRTEQLVQRGYQTILSGLGNSSTAGLAAPLHVWSVIARAHAELALLWQGLQASMKARYEESQLFFETGSVHAAMRDGTTVPADEYTSAILNVAAGALKMFAHQYSWFTADGSIRLPAPPEVPGEIVDTAGVTLAYGGVWEQLQLFETNHRYFGGTVTVDTVEDERGDACEIVTFDSDRALTLTFLVAEQRLRNLMMQHYFQLTNESVHEHLLAGPQAALPPAQYVDAEEIATTITLSHLLHFSVIDDVAEYNGLRIVEWIRGYTVLRNHTEHETDRAIHGVELGMLLEKLRSGGLSEDKARGFVEAVRFSRRSVDLYDAPLIGCEDGRVYYLPMALASTSSVHTVLSQISSSDNLGKKGPAFERAVLELLAKHGIPASGFRFRKHGVELECDSAFVLDDVLFLCELKNHVLPGANAERRYYFMLDMMDAAQQIERIADAVAADASLVRAALGDVTWSRVEKVVLNAMPWSLPSEDGAVRYYDFSALARLLDSRHLNVKTSSGPADRRFVIARRVRSLWTGERFAAGDLIRELGNPFQFQALAEAFRTDEQTTALTEHLHIRGAILVPVPQSLSEQLAALGIAEDAVEDLREVVARVEVFKPTRDDR
jgi:hypothetical protein